MSVLKVKEGEVWKDIPTIVGEAAGFGTVTATVDTNVGTPAVVVTSSGEDTAKNFAFQFKNLGYDDSDLQDDFADLANDFDVLQGQFDTAVAAVTTDTEVTDIRVGADGVTDTTAGASVRRQFTDVKSDINDINDSIFYPTNTNCTIANGTLANPNNGNAVNILEYIPCANGDVVEMFPVRPNTAGYYYQYAYRLYDASKNLILDVNTASRDNKSAKISNASASYIRFAMFEYNGSSYNPLRVDSFGYTPYISVTEQNKLKEYAALSESNFEIPVEYEVGVNRLLTNGVVSTASYAWRASIKPVQIFADKIFVDVSNRYQWYLCCGDDPVSGYSEIEPLQVGSKEVTIPFGSYIFMSFRTLVDNQSIPTNEVPVKIYTTSTYDVLANQSNAFNSELKGLIDDALLYSHAGINRSVEIANGTLVNPNNANAVNTSNYIDVVPNMIARCDVNREPSEGYTYYYAYRVYDSDKTVILDKNSALAENREVTIPTNGAYVRFAIFETDGNDNFNPLRVANVQSVDVKINVRIENGDGSVVALNKYKKTEAKIIKLKKTSGEAYGECDCKFIFATDIHKEIERTARMVELANAWGDGYISSVINGGDTVQLMITESLDWYYNLVDTLSMPILNTVGNHDAWASLGVLEDDPTVVYNKIIAPIVSQSDIVQPTDAETNGYNYYYKDFSETVRVIVLDCMYWNATQLAWFENTLDDANTNGLHVVAVSHAAFPWTSMETVDCLWSKAGLLDGYSDAGAINDPTRTNLQAAQAVKNFMDAGGTFICWLTGHQHGDDVHILPNYGNQFVVTMGSFAQRASMLQKSDVITDYNYDCLTYIAIDTSNKAIKFLRIGADIDMYGVKHNGLSIDYKNNKLIASW